MTENEQNFNIKMCFHAFWSVTSYFRLVTYARNVVVVEDSFNSFNIIKLFIQKISNESVWFHIICKVSSYFQDNRQNIYGSWQKKPHWLGFILVSSIYLFKYFMNVPWFRYIISVNWLVFVPIECVCVFF